jgi:two-component system, chemotaxis family, chemotaxis protein CheY
MPIGMANSPRRENSKELAGRRSRWPDTNTVLTATGADGPKSAERHPGPAQSQQAQIRETCRVLVVDDDLSIRLTVSEFLEDEGYQVTTASNGRDALAIIEQERPTLVLLDMRMPIMDGWGFARELRSREINIRLVVMTAARDARSWAEEIGATAYVAKPFDLSALLGILDGLCSNQQDG